MKIYVELCIYIDISKAQSVHQISSILLSSTFPYDIIFYKKICDNAYNRTAPLNPDIVTCDIILPNASKQMYFKYILQEKMHFWNHASTILHKIRYEYNEYLEIWQIEDKFSSKMNISERNRISKLIRYNLSQNHITNYFKYF